MYANNSVYSIDNSSLKAGVNVTVSCMEGLVRHSKFQNIIMCRINTEHCKDNLCKWTKYHYGDTSNIVACQTSLCKWLIMQITVIIGQRYYFHIIIIGRPLYSKMSFPWNSFGVFGRGCTVLFLKRIVGDSEGTGMLLRLVLLLMPFGVLWHPRFCLNGCAQTWSRLT